MSAFEVVTGDPDSTVVLHVPHSSTHIPARVRRDILLTDVELAAELAAITDADTDLVAERAADLADVRPWIFLNRASRLVIDPERFPDEREELNDVGMGAVYERTTTGEVLRAPTADERAGLIEEFFSPYSDGIAELVRDRLAVVGAVTIIDLHSYPLLKLAYELHGGGPRPEICIGTDEFNTTVELRAAAVSAMSEAAPSHDIELNSPFSGCYVPLEQYGVNGDVQAVMLEIRRDVVADHLDALAAATAALMNAIDGEDLRSGISATRGV